MPITYTPLATPQNAQDAENQAVALATGGQKGGSAVTTPAPAPITPKSGATPVAGSGGSAGGTPQASGAASTPVNPATPSATNAPVGSDTEEDGNENSPFLLAGANSAEQFTENPVTPNSLEDQEYGKYMSEYGNNEIQASEDAYNDEIARAEDTGDTEKGATGAALVAAGLSGSTAVAPALGAVDENTAANVNEITTQRGQAVQGIIDNIRQAAQTNSRTDAANAISYVKTLGQNYVALQDFKSSFPDEYQHVLAAYGGDENALIASGAITAPKVLSSYVQGSNYVQTVQDPVTGKVTAQTFGLSVTPPVGWTSEKLTNAIVFTDPNNAANSITYTTDPLTGALTVNGSGTGLQTLSAAGVQSGQGGSGSGASNGTGATTASTAIASTLGITDPTQPLSGVVASTGVGNVVAAIIKNEGGSPQGVVNNPGNIKYTGAPGQIDSGVKAADGGTFASYKTAQDGTAAIASLVLNPPNSLYGANPSFQDFINGYTGSIDPASATVNPDTGLDTKEYGLLANVSGFDPKSGTDSAAWNYLNQYLTQGKTPTAASVGISTRTGSGAAFNAVSKRADDLYFKATGTHLPNQTTLTSNLGLVSTNNSLLNNLNVQTGTIQKNFDLNLENMTANNINQLPPAVNGILDFLQQQSGSTSVAQYLTQNTTLTQELGNLLALKNASGTTVADKLSAESLLSSNLSLDQQKQILSTLMSEAKNAQQSVGEANAALYQETDPLGIDPNNPVNQPGYQQFSSIGFTNNYDGTWSAPDGSLYKAGPDGNPVSAQ